MLGILTIFHHMVFIMAGGTARNKRPPFGRSNVNVRRDLFVPKEMILIKCQNMFPLKKDQQKEIFFDYRNEIEQFKTGQKNNFFDSLVDIQALRKFNKNESKSTLVIDVGGTFLKIAFVKISPKNSEKVEYEPEVEIFKFDYKSEQGKLPLEQQKWNDWVADIISEKINKDMLTGVENAALTFSYAMNQTSLDHATIHSIAKDWKFSKEPGFMDLDIVDSLNTSLRNRGLKITINCILNDSIATYMKGIMKDREGAYIGFINGTGCNAAYEVEKNGRSILVNSEMAKTKISNKILTGVDREVVKKLEDDNLSYNLLEILIAGYKFLEIVKKEILYFPKAMPLFNDEVKALDMKKLLEILDKKDEELDSFSFLVKKISLSFKRRASKISAALLAAISSQMNQKDITIVVNGSVILHDLDLDMLKTELNTFCKEIELDRNFTFLKAEKASVEGAGFVSLALINNETTN